MHINSFMVMEVLTNYDDGVTIYCYSNLIFFKWRCSKFEQYNERKG